MSSSEEYNQQRQRVDQNSGQVGQAGRDLYQILVQVGSSDFIKDKLEELSFWSRPLHFLRVLFFLFRLILLWLFMGFSTKYKFPFNTLQSLIYATITGDLANYVAENQPQNNVALANIVDGINRDFVSIDEKITLELKTEIIIQLIDFLSPKDIEKKEELADFLAALQAYQNSFTTQISSQKRDKYQEIYEWQRNQKKRKSSDAVQKFIGRLVEFVDSHNPSDTFIYTLLEETEYYILQQKRALSVQDLADIKQIKSLLSIISQKYIVNSSEPSESMRVLYNAMKKELERITRESKNIQKDNNALHADLDELLTFFNKAKSKNSALENENRFLKQEIHDLIQQKKEFERDVCQLQNYSNQLQETSNQIDQRRLYLESQLEDREQKIKRLNDPVFYLQEYSKINYITKKSISKYHNNPKCRDWRGLVLDFIIKKYRDESVEDFMVSKEYDHEKFSNKEKCSNC